MKKKILNPVETIILVFISIVAFAAGSYGQTVKADTIDTLQIQVKQLRNEVEKIKKQSGVKESVKSLVAQKSKPTTQQPYRPQPIQYKRPSGIVGLVYDATVYVFGKAEWDSMYRLIMRESGFNPYAKNPTSGACGIFQANPCSKITDRSVSGQIKWGIAYVSARYSNPTIALLHSYKYGWY